MTRLGVLGARLRLVHPFPSLLNGTVVLAIALIAGGSVVTAARLALSMTLLQFAIGVANDLHDAPRDHGRTPVKPIPAGLVSIAAARVVLVSATIGGLVLAGMSGAPAFGLAVSGLACGFAYDFRLSRTAISWLPLALALPLVPLFAWLGVTSAVPVAIVVVVPIAALAGTGLAIGNALIDLASDVASSRPTVAVALGHQMAWRFHGVAFGVAVLLVAVFLPRDGALLASALIVGGGALLAAGVAAIGRSRPQSQRIAWQLEAAGIGLIGIGWILATATSPA